jgi:crossover junction endodeoxyribonuclease RuvC
VTGYGAADKTQVGRMVSVILQLAEVPTPDDTADALAAAICIANTERPGSRPAGGAAHASVLDRAAVAPITRGETPYDRAVREALARERQGGGSRSSARKAS